MMVAEQQQGGQQLGKEEHSSINRSLKDVDMKNDLLRFCEHATID